MVVARGVILDPYLLDITQGVLEIRFPRFLQFFSDFQL